MKVIVELLASDGSGKAVTLTAGWWVRFDREAHGRWSGTLANHPRVPATVELGSRM